MKTLKTFQTMIICIEEHGTNASLVITANICYSTLRLQSIPLNSSRSFFLISSVPKNDDGLVRKYARYL